MSSGNNRTPWEKLEGLIAEAKVNEELSLILRTGSPKEVTDALQQPGIDITMDDLGEIFADLEYIADRDSIRFWSPLA